MKLVAAGEARQDAPGDAKQDAPGDAKQGLAAERTEFAAERTLLANERTYAAWMRTGLAALVSGLAVLRFLKETLGGKPMAAVALSLLLFGVFSFAAGAWRFVRTGPCIAEAKIPKVNAALVIAGTALLIIATLIAAASALVLA